MANQQKGVQQDTVVVNDPRPCLYHFSMTSKNDIGKGIHMIIHYNCTIGSILLHSFLLICHPYPPCTCSTNFSSLRRARANQKC